MVKALSATAKAVAESSSRYSATQQLRSIELFSGAGGLALGTELAGFAHQALVEWNPDACATVAANVFRASVAETVGWRVLRRDVREFDYRPYEGVDLVAGGPPCQPFSIGGKHRGEGDGRNMIPEFVRAIRELRPPAFMLENVRGLLRPGFLPYFKYVLAQLSNPTITRKAEEDWPEHFARLDAGTKQRLRYNVKFQLVNAADYGVPQVRHRVFVVGIRADLGFEFNFPPATHSSEALSHGQWVSGEYWDRHHLQRPNALHTVDRRSLPVTRPFAEPWVTVRDALAGLPEPSEIDSASVLNHRLQLGARAYTGHTGSDNDLPAKTLKAGDHGVPGGENMLLKRDGTVRYFTVREAARIQTFPDSWEFSGAWSEAMRQIGNAVPVRLAETMARSLADCLRSA